MEPSTTGILGCELRGLNNDAALLAMRSGNVPAVEAMMGFRRVNQPGFSSLIDVLVLEDDRSTRAIECPQQHNRNENFDQDSHRPNLSAEHIRDSMI
ncbi:MULTISPECIES: hypothetical protein [unclassified Rhizobium]|uniref:hypothetical protein n=1 Tax=unclassified Rhizobium TaxID=2613769 RepID=UPI0038001CE4